MTFDEAIQHCKEKAVGCDACSDEHRQLAEWLKELRVLRRINKPVRAKKTGDGMTWWYECTQCGTAIDPHDNYCRHCGQRMEWIC